MQPGRWITITLALAVAVACQHQRPESRSGRGDNVITQEQIDATEAANVYDVVARLHGNFLADRGAVSIKSNKHARAIVFLNDQEYGVPETMRNIPRGRIGEIRFFSGTDASVRFGAQYGGGVIQLISRNQ